MGKHTGTRRRWSPEFYCSVAVATAMAVGGFAATAPKSVSGLPVDLSALIVVGSSTNPTGDGIREFYGGKFDQPDEDVVTVNFWTGPLGVYQTLAEHQDEENIVLSSGWGAANVSLLLTYLHLTGGQDPVVSNATYVLDNNVASPNGGYGTRLPWFALLGVNPIPTPTEPGAQVVNIVSEYEINSNVPAYVLNVPSLFNSLVAYFQRRLDQSELVLPVDEAGNSLVPADCGPSCQVMTPGDGMITFKDAGDGRYEFAVENGDTGYIETIDDTTYVSYKADELPLIALMREFGEPGEWLADLTGPALEAVVKYGYPNNDPLADPEKYVGPRLIPQLHETKQFLEDFSAGVKEGLKTLNDDAAESDVGEVESSEPDLTPLTEKAATDKLLGAKKPLRPLVRKSLDFTPNRTERDWTSTKRPGQPITQRMVDRIGRFTDPLSEMREDNPSVSRWSPRAPSSPRGLPERASKVMAAEE